LLCGAKADLQPEHEFGDGETPRDNHKACYPEQKCAHLPLSERGWTSSSRPHGVVERHRRTYRRVFPKSHFVAPIRAVVLGKIPTEDLNGFEAQFAADLASEGVKKGDFNLATPAPPDSQLLPGQETELHRTVHAPSVIHGQRDFLEFHIFVGANKQLAVRSIFIKPGNFPRQFSARHLLAIRQELMIARDLKNDFPLRLAARGWMQRSRRSKN
jgi:hypothetical protein